MFAVCTTSSQGQCITTGPTDFCKTPTPGGPVPMPYPNIGTTSDGSGSSKVKVLGKESLRKGDKLSKSTGDEPGCAGGGAKSSRFKGNVVLKQGQSKVKVQGKAWAHHTVMTEQNNGNIVGVQCVPSQ
jgi:uncharacterized Zn-binding protein involved in type VI secretion